MTKQQVGEKLKQFAINVGKLVLSLQYNVINKNYGDQLIQCSTSSAANYRSALREKSTTVFAHKLKIVEAELDESLFFLEMIKEFNNFLTDKIMVLHKEANELLAIIMAKPSAIRRNPVKISNVKS